jgi:hypothetical protein
MNYFQPYSFPADDTIVAAWDSQVADAAETPWLAQIFAQADGDLFPRFTARYRELRALPRSARRALQRQLKRSRELTAILPEWLHGRPGRALQRKLAYSLAGAALLLALGQGVSQAATITVTTNKPGINSDGKCSLIEAIINANNDAATHPDCAPGSGADTIVLPRRRTHTLTSAHGNFYGSTGLPVITSPITIQGNGAKIVRKKSSPPFRLMAVNSSGDLTLQNVALSGGSSSFGGGVLNEGTLTIQNSAISGNSANEGGGAFNFGSLTIQNSIISGNSANSGGGIFNSYASVAIENSAISGNTAVYSGGGIFNNGDADVVGSTISGNKARYGGGVFISSHYNSPNTFNLTNSIVSGNEATASGGGIFNSGDYTSCYYYNSPNTCYFFAGGVLSLVDSTITQNVAGASGGGLTNYGSLNRTNTTISNNQAPVGPDVFP